MKYFISLDIQLYSLSLCESHVFLKEIIDFRILKYNNFFICFIMNRYFHSIMNLVIHCCYQINHGYVLLINLCNFQIIAKTYNRAYSYVLDLK